MEKSAVRKNITQESVLLGMADKGMSDKEEPRLITPFKKTAVRQAMRSLSQFVLLVCLPLLTLLKLVATLAVKKRVYQVRHFTRKKCYGCCILVSSPSGALSFKGAVTARVDPTFRYDSPPAVYLTTTEGKRRKSSPAYAAASASADFAVITAAEAPEASAASAAEAPAAAKTVDDTPVPTIGVVSPFIAPFNLKGRSLQGETLAFVITAPLRRKGRG